MFLELFGIENHLIEGWSDQAREANNISLLPLASVNNILTTLHDTHVNNFVVVATKDDSNDVLTNIMHVSFHGG